MQVLSGTRSAHFGLKRMGVVVSNVDSTILELFKSTMCMGAAGKSEKVAGLALY